MTDREALFDRCPADRALSRLRQAKTAARQERRREWLWCIAFAAAVAMALKMLGAI